jgi:cation:H+ antiporter
MTLQLLGGLALIYGGAELLVRGAARLARAFGISSLVIGLTVVAWGTGSPELFFGIKATLTDSPGLNVGNVVGSNIANILLILGFAALFSPLSVSRRLVRLDVPLMIGVSVLTLLVARDGRISLEEGLVFVSALLVYTVWTVRASRSAQRAMVEEHAREVAGESGQGNSEQPAPIAAGVMLAGGVFLLYFGTDLLVGGASTLARVFDVSETVIGLTIVAIGTSLPELATSVVAAARGERDIAVGNVIGSNIFNLLAVFGIIAVFTPDGIVLESDVVRLWLPVMIAVAVASLLVFFAGHIITRWNGALFVALYAAYIAYIVLRATQHTAFSSFNTIVTMFVLPLAALTLIVLVYQSWHKR